MTCIRTMSYSILINGQPFGTITPTRGIRQRDPLSPQFFILCAKGLSSLLQKAERDGRITGLPIVKGGMRLNRLFFANDSLLFCKANIMEWVNIQEILKVYEFAFGQKLNREKTSISLSRNTKGGTKHHLLSMVGVSSTTCYETYLGLPAMIGHSKENAFSGLKRENMGEN